VGVVGDAAEAYRGWCRCAGALLSVIAGLVLLADPAAAKRPSALCRSGRFLVEQEPLVPGGALALDAITLERGDVRRAAAQEQFLEVVSAEEARARFERHLDLTPLGAEAVPLAASLGRVLAH